MQIIIIKNGQKETKKKKSVSILGMAMFLALLEQPSYNGLNWEQYIENLIKYNSSQIYRQAIMNVQQGKELNIDSQEFQKIINNQQKQKINIKDNKISGAADLQMIALNNKAKVEGMYLLDHSAKVKFVAVQDNKTTKMCDSLDGQIFNVHGWNEFYRYSDTNKTNIKVKCFGLVYGLNLPPVDDNFHWCRSTIRYLPPVEKQKELEYNIPNYLQTKIEKFYKNSLNDFKIIQKEYDMLPQNVKNKLEKEKIIIVLNPSMNYSGYDPKLKKILLIPGLEQGEFIHEVGHALEYIENIANTAKYQNVVKSILKGNKLQIKNDRTMPYIGLQNEEKCVSSYQTFLGFNKEKAINNVKFLKLPELISEAYREYYFNNKNLKASNLELYELIKEIEKNA